MTGFGGRALMPPLERDATSGAPSPVNCACLRVPYSSFISCDCRNLASAGPKTNRFDEPTRRGRDPPLVHTEENDTRGCGLTLPPENPQILFRQHIRSTHVLAGEVGALTPCPSPHGRG